MESMKMTNAAKGDEIVLQGRKKVGKISETGKVTALVESAAQGDKQAFVALIDLHRQTMYATAMAVIHNEADAMDAIQDVILILWEKLHTLQNPKVFKTWMLRILVHRCSRMLKTKRREVPTDNVKDILTSPEEYTRLDEAADVQRSMELLSEDDKLILQLFYFEDLSVYQIAKVLSINPEAVRMRLSRSRRRFQKRFDMGGTV
ncbi:MAG: sigma-70 family RNA polymerase sigma factor [Acutalibacter sp.]|nr:sigma-70 family RNA polymerase sigma factor [Acutalibacter sp.]